MTRCPLSKDFFEYSLLNQVSIYAFLKIKDTREWIERQSLIYKQHEMHDIKSCGIQLVECN